MVRQQPPMSFVGWDGCAVVYIISGHFGDTPGMLLYGQFNGYRELEIFDLRDRLGIKDDILDLTQRSILTYL